MTIDPALSEAALAALFHEARTQNAWADRPLPAGTAERLWDAVKMGPTSANCLPGRLLFIESPEAKARLEPLMSSGNRAKTMTAPMTVIVCQDMAFYDKLPELFPHVDARPWFTGSPEKIRDTAARNSTLMGGYLILAARAMGLDCGPMSGFDAEGVAREFLDGTGWEPNFMVNIGYGDPAGVQARLPRLAFADACRIL